MATTQVVKCRVEALTKYGFKMNGRYVNFSKQFKESDKVGIVPGAEFEAEFYVADSGKEYLNRVTSFAPIHTLQVAEVISSSMPTAPKPEAKVDESRAKHFTPKFKAKDDTSMSKADWQAKDRSQLIGGLSHDAAALVAAMISVVGDLATLDHALVAYKKVLEGMIKIRTEVQ